MNKNIIDQFKLLLKQIQFEIDISSTKQIANMYRLKSIIKVIKQLEKYDKKIISSKQLKNIEGIGAHTLLRIDEILKTGKLSEIKITEDIDKYLHIIEKLEDVFGIGRKKAYELFMKHNIKSIKELKEKYKNGEIELSDNIIKGLKYLDLIKENIPRQDIENIYDDFQQILFDIDPKLFGILCGSFRREKKLVNDIDFLIFHTDMKTKKDIEKHNYLEIFIKKLKDKKFIVESLTSDTVATKYMGICKLNGVLRRIDIRYIAYESYYPAILYFTGPKDLNKKMRNIAISMDYLLNEYGLYDNKKMIIVKSEKDIFEQLGMEYLQPALR